MTVEQEWHCEIGEETSGSTQGILPLVLSRHAIRVILRDAPNQFGLAFRVLYASGVREDELLGLTSSDRLDQGRLRVNNRVVCLDDETARALSGLEGPLFPFGSEHLRAALQDTAPEQYARFQSLGRVLLPSAFRHAYATHCLENGMDLFVLFHQLGHHSLYNTMRYLDAAIAFRGGHYAKYHPLMAGQIAPAAWSTRDFLKQEAATEIDDLRKVTLERATPTFEEILQMFQAAKSPRDMLLMRVMYATSIRVSELLNLRPGDLDDSECKVFVRQAKDGQDGYVLIDPETLRLLRLLTPIGPSLLGLTNISSVARCIDKIAAKLGLQQKYHALGQDISPHSFRHAYATHCYAAGMSPSHVRALLGHDSLKNTELYIECPFSHYRSVYEACQS